jgi:hypothetical protein
MECAVDLLPIVGLIAGGAHQSGKFCWTNEPGDTAVMEGGSCNPRSLVLQRLMFTIKSQCFGSNPDLLNPIPDVAAK